jgi:hypothetical protein
MRKLFFPFVLLLFVCCGQHSPQQAVESFKDSVVKEYLARADSLDFYDTTNYHFRILKAYMKNDAAFFIKMKKDAQQSREEAEKYPRLDSCVHLAKLSDLPVDEAYRFSHGQSFCDYGQRITITRSGIIIKLHYIEYSNGDGHTTTYLNKKRDTITIQPYCVLIKEFEKDLSMMAWDELEERIENADYWGLKPYHYRLSTDGSSWQIEAYTKRPKEPEGQQIHFVSRHCSCNPSFKALGEYFLKLSGEQTMCGEFF